MTAFDEVKARIDVVDLISPYVALRKSGRGYIGRCPFHDDSTPSFTVYPDTWTFHCFGCGADGSGFDFVMRQEGLTFGEALRKLAGQAGVVLPERSVDPVAKERRGRLHAAVEAAAAYFRDQLRGPAGEPARTYLAERGIERTTIEAFGLGFAPPGWDNLLRYLSGLGFAPELQVEAGLAVEREERSSRYDRFRNRLIVPIHDRDGIPIAFGARALAAEDQPKYLNSPETPIFSKSSTLFALDRATRPIQQADQAIIVEGYFDAISAHQAGYRSVVAQMGTALTERQARLLTRLTKHLILALDTDAAGREATLRGLEVVQSAAETETTPVVDWRGYVRFAGGSDVDLRVLTLPVGKDPDELFRREPQRWAQLVAEARPVVEHLFAVALEGLDREDPTAKARVADMLLPALRQIPDQITRASYVQRLARELGVDSRTLLAQRPAAPRPTHGPPVLRGTEGAPIKLAPERTREHYALALLARYAWLDPAAVGLAPELFDGPAERQLFLDPDTDEAALGELKVRIATFPLHGVTEQNAERELEGVAAKLRDWYHRRNILGGGVAAEAPDQLALAGDEAGRLLSVWKARGQRGDR
ncbi:MAG: DNA primase [Dehalococcoidia bacterium]